MAQQRRHKSRRRPRGRFPGLYKAISALLIGAAVVVACVIFFRVDQVVVQGNRRYTAQEIIEVTGVEKGDNLITVNGSRINRELRTRLPYIQTVSVRRLLPDTLAITVTEGEAAAAIPQGGKWWLMSAGGKLLEEAASPMGYPEVEGITPLAPAVGTYLATGEEQQEKVAQLKELLAALAENELLDRLDSVDMTRDYQIGFAWDGRFTVELNPTLEKGMAYWLRRFAECLKDPAVAENQYYQVVISDGQVVRFIPR